MKEMQTRPDSAEKAYFIYCSEVTKIFAKRCKFAKVQNVFGY